MSKVPLLRGNSNGGNGDYNSTTNRMSNTRRDFGRTGSSNSITNILNTQRQPIRSAYPNPRTKENTPIIKARKRAMSRSGGRSRMKNKSNKLNTLNGVTLPTTLNVLSILLFLRFGFIIGQMGVIGTIGLLILSYGINLLTTLSISAIATNGTVKGGGAYYMLSRSLGVEFGGGIGIIFYIGQILNSSMNVAGLVEPLMYNFNDEDGILGRFLPVSYWWQFTYCTVILFICIIVALIGSSAVSNAGKYLCMILIFSIISIPISCLLVTPFDDYSGLSFETFKGNLWPNFTKGAAGSQMKGKETFNDLFGIFFPATAGILAGASMSGDLANPSKSIPKGTLNGLLITFGCYLIVILSMGASIPRKLLYSDTEVLQKINFSPFIILAGELSTSIFSIIVGIVGAAKLLQAIARDEILPGLKIFGRGDPISDDPKEAILLTWLICQLFLFADLNQIATFITMAFLMTFIVTNLACFLLKVGSAPNFRPSFKYFSSKSALSGSIACFLAMFIVDGMSACIIIALLILMMISIHFVSTPKSWGDVSQSLIYHQVRKYLFKLRQDNVKYWRPQILLLVDNPRTSWKLISFCNSLKKGGLYILGHVYITHEGLTFQQEIEELNKARENWKEIRNISKVKAFVQMCVCPTFSWGVRNVFLGSGLGGMKPNITIIGFYDLSRYDGPFKEKLKIPRKYLKFENEMNGFNEQVRIDIESLPTDSSCMRSKQVKLEEWVETLVDLSLMNSNIAIAKGFPRLELPNVDAGGCEGEMKYIDLYPIQMNGNDKRILTSNFDTCTLILQMGAILHTVPMWRKRYKIRVVVFVEEAKDVEEERRRLMELLEILRMSESEVMVICLEESGLSVYDYIVKGEHKGKVEGGVERLEELLKDDGWWQDVKRSRRFKMMQMKRQQQRMKKGVGKRIPKVKISRISKSYSESISRVKKMGVDIGGMSMQAGKLDRRALRRFAGRGSESESEDSSCESESESDSENNSESEMDSDSDSSVASGSSASTMKRSAFTAERMPKSRVRAEAEGNDASIEFDVDEEDEEEGEGEGEGEGEDSYGCGYGVSFGTLSRRAQFLVLNELMVRSSGGSALVFCTLPLPDSGGDDAVEWAVDTALWTAGLPPLLLLGARTVTVTSAL